MKRFFYTVFGLMLIAIVTVLFFYFQINGQLTHQGKEHLFTIAKGETVRTIGNNLLELGLLKSYFNFQLYVWLTDKKAKFQAGDYALNSSYNIKQIVDILTSGQAQSRERNITIIEGWGIKEMETYFSSFGLSQDGSFSRQAESKTTPWNFSFAKPTFLEDAPKNASLEGYLFPDTYRVYQDATVEEVIKKMLDNFGRKIDQETLAEINRQGKSLYQILTMAAIIEKEVKTYEDMRIVSGIFWNRIKSGQALQSCATLAYVLGVNKKQYTYEDTKIDSPYNTYQNPGLPPGPIANPGLNAIKAAVYPVNTNFNYFLSRQDNGATVFSRNFDEHNLNKAKYLN